MLEAAELPKAPSSSAPGLARARNSGGVLWVGLTLLGLAALGLLAWPYRIYLVDDSLISLRFAQRLLEGHGLTWTDGQRVEGYSNLLWVLASAALGALGIDLIVALRILGFAGMGAAVLALCRGRRGRPFSQLAALGIYLLAVPILVWTVGGLEQPLLAALLAWGWVLARKLVEERESDWRAALAPGVCFGLACWTRPDVPLFVAMAALGVVLARGFDRRTLRAAVTLALVPALFAAAQLAFRLAYYGQWLPNTALIKLEPTEVGMRGRQYIRLGLQFLTPVSWLVLLAGLALLFSRRRRGWALFLLLPVVAWSGYMIKISGDIFPFFRQFVPLLVLFALLGAEAVAVVEERLRGALPRAALALGLVASFSWYVVGQKDALRDNYPRAMAWEGEVVGDMLRRGFGREQPLLAVDAAGCLPYFSHLPSLDMLGLCDRQIAQARAYPAGRVGHRHGDGAYVFSREPDLILFNHPIGGAEPLYKSGREMLADPRFLQTYSLTYFEGSLGGPRGPSDYRGGKVPSHMWVRRFGGKVGAVVSERSIVVPSYLVNGNPASVVRLDAQERFAVGLESARPAWIADLPVPAGRWRLGALADGELVAEVRAGERSLARGPLPLVFEAPGAEALTVRFESPRAELREVRLEREDP